MYNASVSYRYMWPQNWIGIGLSIGIGKSPLAPLCQRGVIPPFGLRPSLRLRRASGSERAVSDPEGKMEVGRDFTNQCRYYYEAVNIKLAEKGA